MEVAGPVESVDEGPPEELQFEASEAFWKRPLSTTSTPGRIVAVGPSFQRAWPTRALAGTARKVLADEPLNPFDSSNSRASSEDPGTPSSPSGSSSRRTPSLPPLSSVDEGGDGGGAAAGSSSRNGGASSNGGGSSNSSGGSGAGPATEAVPMTPTRTVSAVLSGGSSGGMYHERDAYSQSDERMQKFLRLMNSASLDLDALRTLSWSGIPANVRPTAWRLLSGYLPANVDRRSGVLERRRAEYRGFVDQHYPGRHERNNAQMLHQVQVDIERMFPGNLFSQPLVKLLFERLLYVYHVRHPGTGYVQGMNDLVVPFFSVFLSPYAGQALDDIDITTVAPDVLSEIEADSYWCFSTLVDVIQDYFTPDRPGLQKQVQALQDLMGRIDAPLNAHLEMHGVSYLQFAFRWMNCLLMRELPLHAITRLWDTYLSEANGFGALHLYTSAAFLSTFSEQIRASSDLSEIMMFILNPPTSKWGAKEVALLLADAYRLKYMFQGAQRHLSSVATPIKT